MVDRPVGNRRIYQLNPDGVDALRAQLDRFWTKARRRIKRPPNDQKGGRMTTQAQDTSVHAQTAVDVPIERAFALFTEQFDSIKPREHNMLRVDIAESVFEPREGGRLYDSGVDGSECQWARVPAYEPPNRLLFSWDISPQWQIETDPEKTSEVEVRFISETPERTRVELEHRNLDRHGEGWESERDGVAGAGGWPLYLNRFAELAMD